MDKVLAGLVLVLLSLLSTPVLAQTGNEEAICLTSAVFFCDNFEDQPLGTLSSQPGYKHPGWLTTDSTGGLVQSAQAFSGTKAIRLTTPANTASGGTTETVFPGGLAYGEFYWRMYMKFDAAYIWSPVGTKAWEILTSHGQQTGNGFFNRTTTLPPYLALFFSGDPRGVCEGDACQFFTNEGGAFDWQVDRWYCVELHIRFNTTPSASDGLMEAWVDGIRRWNYPNLRVDNQTGGPQQNIFGLFLPTYWNCDDTENCSAAEFQHPNLHRYFDNVVVSTQRIGCLGTQSPTPPGTPANLTVTDLGLVGLVILAAMLTMRRARAVR